MKKATKSITGIRRRGLGGEFPIPIIQRLGAKMVRRTNRLVWIERPKPLGLVIVRVGRWWARARPECGLVGEASAGASLAEP